jgi:hypothetical protein
MELAHGSDPRVDGLMGFEGVGGGRGWWFWFFEFCDPGVDSFGDGGVYFGGLWGWVRGGVESGDEFLDEGVLEEFVLGF